MSSLTQNSKPKVEPKQLPEVDGSSQGTVPLAVDSNPGVTPVRLSKIRVMTGHGVMKVMVCAGPGTPGVVRCSGPSRAADRRGCQAGIFFPRPRNSRRRRAAGAGGDFGNPNRVRGLCDRVCGRGAFGCRFVFPRVTRGEGGSKSGVFPAGPVRAFAGKISKSNPKSPLVIRPRGVVETLGRGAPDRSGATQIFPRNTRIFFSTRRRRAEPRSGIGRPVWRSPAPPTCPRNSPRNSGWGGVPPADPISEVRRSR